MKRRRIFRRVEALLLACGTLWLAAVTAGSENAAAAWKALGDAAPLGVLQWELGDFRRQDGLSAAAALAIGQSPLLLAAGPASCQNRPGETIIFHSDSINSFPRFPLVSWGDRSQAVALSRRVQSDF